MKKVNVTKYATNGNENVMPLPLDSMEDMTNNGYNEQSEKELFELLQSSIYRTLKPFVDRALQEEDYYGSPIYNGHIDRDTIGAIVDKTIYYAQQEIPAIAQLIESIDEEEYGKSLLLRTIVQQIVLYEIFFVLRPIMQNEINYNSSNNTQNTNQNNDIIMPMPLNNISIA